MKEQSNENPISKYAEVEHLKCKKRFYRYEDTDKSIYLSKKRFLNLNNNNHNNNNSQKPNGRFNNNEFNGIEEEQDEETLIRETQAALKSLSGSWCESNTISETIETNESPTFPNLFEEKNGSRKMSPATAPPLNSNYDLSSYRDLYSHNNNGKPKSVIQSKKSRPNEEKFQSHDFNELLVDDGTNVHQHNDKMTKSEKSDSVTYEMNSDYRMPSTTFSVQSSAFRPPLYDGIKKPNSFASMPLSAYQYTDPNGGGYYEKPFAKDEEMNVHDSKEYTTLQPAGVGSKAASVIQDIAREGVASVSVVSNSTARNPTSTHSNAERTFIERPAFSPGSTNKGKFNSQKD